MDNNFAAMLSGWWGGTVVELVQMAFGLAFGPGCLLAPFSVQVHDDKLQGMQEVAPAAPNKQSNFTKCQLCVGLPASKSCKLLSQPITSIEMEQLEYINKSGFIK